MRELQSEDIKDLVAAMVAAQKTIHHAFYDAENPHFKSDYATLESVIDAIKPAFLDNGLTVLQQPCMDDQGRSILITTVAHVSGQWTRSFTPIINEKNNCQSMGSGISYARRYALSAMGFIGQKDDDGNLATEAIGAPQAIVRKDLVNLPKLNAIEASKPNFVQAKGPSCCEGKAMLVSKFNDTQLYCPKCKKTVARVSQ